MSDGKFKSGDKFRRVVRAGTKRHLQPGYEGEIGGVGFYFVWCSEGHTHDPVDLEIIPVTDQRAGPIRVETRREIVPGEYGPVSISGSGMFSLNGFISEADELREAARILDEIADAMDEGASILEGDE